MVSQKAGIGTVTPTHYMVINNEGGMKPDILQRITYRLTFMYFNWTGNVSVPAPCLVS